MRISDWSSDVCSSDLTAGVANLGSLVADGGAVLLQAKVASNMLHTVVNNQGQISATDIEGQGGSIELVATGGNLETQATLEASGALGGGGIELSSANDILIGDPRPDSGEVQHGRDAG